MCIPINFSRKPGPFETYIIVPGNQYGRILRHSDASAQSPTSSKFESHTVQKLPRVKLNKQNSNRQLWTDNCYVNNSARNNYEQFLSK